MNKERWQQIVRAFADNPNAFAWTRTAKELIGMVKELEAENAKLRTALQEITKGKGRFAVDQLQFATNTIEDMVALAEAALAETEPKTTEAAGG